MAYTCFSCLRAVGFEPGTFRLQVLHAYLSPTQCHGLGIRPYTLCIRPYTHGIRPYTPSIRPYTASIRPYTCPPILSIQPYTPRYTAVYSEVYGRILIVFVANFNPFCLVLC